MNSVSQTLASAAFGAEPGHWPLPSASDPSERWLRAVAAAGQGYYGCAHSELAAVRRELRNVPGAPLLSLAHSTQGSLLRQLGRHALARGWDGRAALLASTDTEGDVEARVDALIGLAADALGVGRFAASATLLDHARTALAGAIDPPARLAIRVQWVSAELAMATGDGVTAVRHAEKSVELAERTEASIRHRVKSNVVLAAALCCSSRLEEARTVADIALEATGKWGLIPLRWALASLLDGIGSGTRPGPEVRAIRDEAALVVRERGGSWCDS